MDVVPRPEADFLRERAPREVQPRLVEVGRQALRVVRPDHHGRGVGHESEALFALAESLLGAAPLGDVVDDADHAHGLAGRIAVRAVGRDRPARFAGLRNRIGDVLGGGGVAAQRPREQLVDAALAKEREGVERPPAEHALRRQAGHLLHVAVEDDVSQVAVVDDDALAGAVDDLLPELVGFLQLLARALPLGDVLDDAFVVEKSSRGVADGAGPFADRDDLPAVALPLQLHVVDFARALEPVQELTAGLGVDVDVAHVHGHEALARRKAEKLQERRVGVQHLSRKRGAVEADGNAFEEGPVARFGLARDPPPRRLFESRADRRDQAREVMRMLEDVIVEARLHRRDRELFAPRARAEEHRHVEGLLADPAEQVERVDPTRTVIRDDDVEGRRVDQLLDARGIFDLDEPAAGESGPQRLGDQSAIARVLIDDEKPQRFAGGSGARCCGAAGRGIGKHGLSVSGSRLCPSSSRTRAGSSLHWRRCLRA